MTLILKTQEMTVLATLTINHDDPRSDLESIDDTNNDDNGDVEGEDVLPATPEGQRQRQKSPKNRSVHTVCGYWCSQDSRASVSGI
jgi:hypothetical protein